MKPKEFFYLLWYSVKSFFADVGEMFKELLNPKTWSYLTIAAMFVSVWYNQVQLLKILVPVFLLIKIVRHNLEGKFRHELYQKELLARKDTPLVRDKYDEYVTKANINKYTPSTFEEWREKEIKLQRSSIVKD